jgi:hypothetical protein
MKTILRNTTTGFYLQESDTWTDCAGTALDFKSTERLIQFVREAQANTHDLEMVLTFDEARYNISLPLDERFGVYAAPSIPRAPEIRS